MHFLKIWLGLSLMTMIRLRASSAASISKEVGVLALLKLAGPEELPYSEKVRSAVEKWTEAEQKCPHGGFWYGGKCHALNFDSELCDRRTEVIVLEKPKERGTTFPLKPICKKVECSFDSVWWPPLKKCIKDEEAEKICGEHGEVAFDIFDDAFCECSPTSGNLFQDDKCYKFYYQGPCHDGELFKPSVLLPSRGVCDPNVEPINANKLDESVKPEVEMESLKPELNVDLVNFGINKELVKFKVTEELVKPEVTEELLKPEVTEELLKSEVTEELLKSEHSEELAKPEIIEELMKPEVTEELLKSEVSEELAKPEISEELMKPEVSEELVNPEVIKEMMKPGITEQSMNSEVNRDLTKLINSEEIVNRDLVNSEASNETEPDTKLELVKPEIKLDLVNSDIYVESVKPILKDDLVDPEITVDSENPSSDILGELVRPEIRINLNNEASTIKSVMVKKATVVKVPEISVESVKSKIFLESVNIKTVTASSSVV